MRELRALRSLAKAMGVHTRYTDGLGRRVRVTPETLLRVCTALGVPVTRPADAADALRAHRAAKKTGALAPVLVAWDGVLPPVAISGRGSVQAEMLREDGTVAQLEIHRRKLRLPHPLPFGYHRLTVHASGGTQTCTVIAAPVQAFRRPGAHRSWGVGSQLAALRSARSRSLGDLRDLESVCRWVGDHGGDLVMVLPVHPTFNPEPPEPSPYSPVSRLFWSELILDLGDAHRPTAPPTSLDVTRADAEVRAAMAGLPAPDSAQLDDELVQYARFRGAQVRLGRNWRAWPTAAQAGTLVPDHIDAEEERFHLVAQTLVRRQLHDLRQRLDGDGIRLGLDLAVGVHPDGYDPWSRQTLFGQGMSVGAPPDGGFPSGQDWGFAPVLPEASRREGHRYLAASIANQTALSGVLRVDHIMAWTRLYWIPHGFGLHEGTYVSYPAEELFAILTLESNRHRCEVVGENLGTVPPEIDKALPRHRIWGTYLAQFQASKDPDVAPPTAADMAQVGTHDTPTFAGWLVGADIDERVRHRLLAEEAVPSVREERSRATQRLADMLDCSVDEPQVFLAQLLEWLGRSDSPLVVPWLEDLVLEDRGVNLPGTRSSERPNWQRPMRKLLDEIFGDPEVAALVRRLNDARNPE
ncbi:MAG: 4-alpha-glucanotransferase [Gemmatimonadota bacterium]|nr:4-alpha-glucanotransferase [Gemmatimonadota bacterium]MDH3479037.1 4-alpha-glucanotransferase [Gemmatimonadota bacterium]MDH3570267.1 4-alpha-glucanotransferase [Gemmatimonadota bacterium]MDH5550651.1 4-alpha-glucanotransferase [Gemmatimonadota bacterium]